jgi:predicted acylesterase/phospholipase RssA/CRP-like cAMP-binding protein
MNQPDSQSSPPDLTVALFSGGYESEEALIRDFARYGLETELERVHLPQGQTLFGQGEPADCLYILVQGRLGVRIENPDGSVMVIDELERPFSTVGEMALLTRQVHVATVYALADADLFKCSKKAAKRLAEIDPPGLVRFVKAIALRLQRTQLVGVLADLFGELDAAAIVDLQAELEWHQLSHGETLFRQGDPGDAMYIVINGRLRVVATSPEGSDERIVGEVGSGEIVGEFSFLTDEAHSATAYAIRETNLVKLTKPIFTGLLERYPQAMMQIARTIIVRQRTSIRVSPARHTRALTIALIPASQEVPLSEFGRNLYRSLEDFCILYLDHDRFDRLYGRRGASQTTLGDPISLIVASWMSEQETEYQYIFYAAEPTWSPWTQRCVRQADRIFIVGQSDADPEPGPVEAAIQSLEVAARTELVLLHPAGITRPTGTSKWLAQRQVYAHHHVRINEDAHYQRLARTLTGRTVDLVLSGGAARGFAHLGVFRALEESGIQIDRVGGTSMGALLGAAYAMGRNYEGILKLARAFANPKRLFDYTLPFTSLMASKKVTNMAIEVFGGLYIEDLWRPFFCVSSSLTRAEPVLHQTGLLWKCVRASIAIPGIFTPILHGGDMLVDGGALNNFPVDIMCGLCEGGAVIGVNVSPPEEKVEAYEFGTSISGWQVLWSRINPFVKHMHVPTLAANLIRSLEISSVHQIKSQQSFVDVLIQPDVKRFGMLDFADYEAVAQVGYQAAREQLALWQDRRKRGLCPRPRVRRAESDERGGRR